MGIMRPTLFAIVTAAVCMGLTATCEEQRLPVEPRSKAPTFQVRGMGGANGTPISEQLQVTLVFEGPGESRLAPSAIIRGASFALHLQQSFDAIRKLVALQVSIENLSPNDVWRPIRAEALDINPSNVFFLDTDNGVSGAGAKWD